MHAPAHHPSLSDDAYAVLVDVARQPRSILLATTPQSATRELLEPPAALTPSATRLTSAERHLLAHHRDEVARWLEVAAARVLMDDPSSAGGRCYPQSTADTWFHVPTRGELLDECAQFLPFLDGPSSRALRDAQWRLRRSRSSAHNALALAALAHRFAPNPMARLCAAVAWFQLGAHTATAHACSELVATSAAPHVSHVAWAWLGASQSTQTRWRDAAESYRRAYAASGAVMTGIWALVNALQAGQEGAARQLAEELHPHWDSTDRYRNQLAAGVSAARSTHSWAWTQDGQKLLREIESLEWLSSGTTGEPA